jgi:ubiquitin C-terminal hydrolase
MSEEAAPYGLAGLANIGNTCYANSVLQALRVIPEWSAISEREDLEIADGPSKKVFLAYQDIVRTLWSRDAVKGAICRPMAFWRDVRESVKGTVYDCFRESQPQDAHEFLSYLLDQCHMALAGPAPDEPLYEQLGRKTSAVVDTFFGWDRVQCICQACNATSTRYEPFNTLKVGLNNTIECPVDLAAADREDEELEDYACEKCSPTRTKATIRRELWKLPRTMIYMLRRFTADGRKDSTAFNYNGETISFERLFAKDAPESKGVSYRPIATIEHMGSAGGGHYFAQVYHPLQKEWYVFDDERGERIEKPRFTVLTYMIVLSAT